VSFIRLKSATASRTITQMRAGTVVSLEGEDPQPYRHQIVEIPPVVAQVEEHRFHQLECPGCGCGTRAWKRFLRMAMGWCGGACSGLKQLVSSFTTYGSASSRIYLG